MSRTYVLLWSHSQCAFHIEPHADMLDANALAFKEDRRMDYVALMAGTDDECHRMADKLRPILRKRQVARADAMDAIDAARRKA